MLLRINERGAWNQDIEALRKLSGDDAVTKQDYEVSYFVRVVNR